MREAWKYLFGRKILERGKEIAFYDEVDKITKNGNEYNAVVHGTRDYEVSVEMEGDEVVSLDCTCPYAESGYSCKHEAALLFRLEELDFEVRESSESMEDILNAMTEEELREEMKKIVDEHPDIRRYLKNRYRTESADLSYPDKVYAQLNALAYQCGDRSGFVDWKSGDEYVLMFDRCLSDMIDPMIRRSETMIAFRSLCRAFDVLNEVEMDGSGGEHGMIADQIEQYWDRVIRMASEEERDAMHEWFVKMKNREDDLLCADSLDIVLEHSFDDPKYLTPLIGGVRKELDDHAENESWAEMLLEKYRNLLERSGRGLNEYEAWLNSHAESRAVKKIRLEEALGSDDKDSAIRYLEDLLKEDCSRWEKTALQEQLLDLYDETGNREKEKHLRKEIVLVQGSMNSSDISALRALCEKEEWDLIREEYLAKNQIMKPAIYLEEKLYDKLLECMPQQSAETVNQYLDALKDRYPEEMLRIYIDIFSGMEQQRACTRLYEQMRECLLHMSTISGGRETARRIMDDWAAKYPTRKAMLRMLDEVRRAAAI